MRPVNLFVSLKGCVTAVILLCIAAFGPGQSRMALAATEHADLALYAMPDGTLPTLCASGASDKPVDAIDHCVACFLAAPIPGPESLAAAPRDLRAIDGLAIAASPAPIDRPWARHSARGPPTTVNWLPPNT